MSSTCCCRFSMTAVLTDAKGRTVSFKETVIIMTSNIASDRLIEGIVGGEIPDAVRAQVEQELRHHFRPEFLNRVDDTILFKPLSRTEIGQIVLLLTADLRQRLAERRLTLNLSTAACDYIADSAYDPVYGARPLKRFLQQQLETRIGRALISGEAVAGGVLSVELENGELVINISAAV